MMNPKRFSLTPALMATAMLLAVAVVGVGIRYRSNKSGLEANFLDGGCRTVAGSLKQYVKDHGSYPPDLNHFQARGRPVDLNGPNAMQGPEGRTFRIVLGRDQAQCVGPAPQHTTFAIPPDGFAVLTNHKEDGCYVPKQ